MKAPEEGSGHRSDANGTAGRQPPTHGAQAAARPLRAETIAGALVGRRSGSEWMARCPAHDDREPSLSLRDADDGRILVRCHAGCDQLRVISELRALGLWPGAASREAPRQASRADASSEKNPDEAKRRDSALRIWHESSPAAGTLVETYLASRGLRLPSEARIRFHPSLRHRLGGEWPAMVALVSDGSSDAPLAIHRTFLARDGSGKGPVDHPKMMLGPCRSGAVRLAEPGKLLMLGEGIETCIAAMQSTGHPTWAALSASGLRRIPIPSSVSEVILLADGDEPGEDAALACARRLRQQGRRVRIASAPSGSDFNDMLQGRAPSMGNAQ